MAGLLSLVFAILACFGLVVFASPTISLPINSQVPPVAQAGQSFSFTFSYATFSSTSTIKYDISNAPSWLKIQSTERRLYGRPQHVDIGSHQFNLVADDGSGSATMPVTLVVLRASGPSISGAFQQQLEGLGTFQSPRALLFYPESPISLTFAADTFQETDSSTQFYAVGANNTPLPSWLQFDPDTLTFRGTTPAFTSPVELPQDIDLKLIASDVPGFSQAIAAFRITVESHELLFTSKNYTIEVEAGGNIRYGNIAETLMIDGQPMPLSNISSVSTDKPSWLQLDTSTLVFSGTAPSNVGSSNFTLTVADSIGDTATTSISIVAPNSTNLTNLILGSIGPINVTIGQSFNYTLSKSDFADGNISITMDAGNASSWLNFDSETLTLSGTVPSDSRPQRAEINIMASEGGQSQSQGITLNLVSANQGQPSTSMIGISPTSSGTGSAPPTASTVSSNNSGPSHHPRLSVVLPAVLCPIFGVILLMLIFCCLRRRSGSKDKNEQSTNHSKPAVSKTIVRKHSFFHGARIFRMQPGPRPLLPAPVPGSSRGPVRAGQNESPLIDANGIMSVPYSARPVSRAPQIMRDVLDRDQDPLEDFRQEHQLVDEPRPDSVMLPAPLSKSLLRRRSQSEPQRQSYRRSRTSVSSLLNKAAHGRLSAMLQNARNRNSGQSEFELAEEQRRPNTQPQDAVHRGFESFDGTNAFDFQTQPDSTRSDRAEHGGSEPVTTSGEWTTTDSMEPSSSSGNGNRNTSSTIDAFFAQDSIQRRRGKQADSRFANTTIRGVTPSVSDFSASNASSPSKRHSRRGSLLGNKRASQISTNRKRLSGSSVSRPLSSSPGKSRRSWGYNSQYGDYLRSRRQNPATLRFSNSGLYRQPSSNYQRSSSIFESNSSTSGPGDIPRSSSDGADKENLMPPTTPSSHPPSDPSVPLGSPPIASPSSILIGRHRKRSRGSVQKLGRQIQMGNHHLSPLHTQGRNLPAFSSRMRTDSTRSIRSASTSASDISFRAIEEEVAEMQENARYWKSTRQHSGSGVGGGSSADVGSGVNRRSSWHRLSALPEFQGQTGASPRSGEALRVVDGKGAAVQTKPREDLAISRSFKGELGEWRGTDDEGSVKKGGMAGGPTNRDEGLRSHGNDKGLSFEREELSAVSSDVESDGGTKAFI